MRKRRIPSLRNFAVLGSQGRSFSGRYWLVRDRRNQTVDQFLFVPGKWKAWPMYLAGERSLSSSPVRLRDGSVAILFEPGVDCSEVRRDTSLRSKSSWTFDALTGFHKAKTKKLRLGTLSSAGIGLLVILLAPNFVQKIEPKVTKPVVLELPEEKCGVAPIRGKTLHLVKPNLARLAGTNFQVKVTLKLGGLRQVILVRECDQAKFKVRAWQERNFLVIESVD